ncbi:hypothetical protein BH24ACT22_BH24ACT22_01120 [soil metagenome]
MIGAVFHGPGWFEGGEISSEISPDEVPVKVGAAETMIRRSG